MLYPQLLLGLAATVSAIDAYFHLGQNCDGPGIVCTNLNPGVCCFGSGANTVGYRGIPTNWNLEILANGGGGCDGSGWATSATNTNFVCHRNRFGNPVTGTIYHFRNGKRVLACEDQEAAIKGSCRSSQKPDTLVLEDGTSYDITGLDEGALNEL